MRNLISLFSVLSGAVLLAASAHADDNAQANRSEANVFNADMSNPNLAAVITSFQDVCLPFIMHTSEVDPKLNREHHIELLAQQGFAHQSLDTRSYPGVIESRLTEWKRASQVATPPKYFPIFNGVSNQLVTSTEVMVPRSGEIIPRATPSWLRTVTARTDTFTTEAHPRQTVQIGWRSPYKTYQAEVCRIRLNQPAISNESFKADFINKDADWLETNPNSSSWIQCTMGGADAVQFSVSHTSEELSITVMREGIFEPKLCDELEQAAP